MLFNSMQFLIFFPVVLVMYFILPKKVKMLWLLFSSYFFYMCWNARYAILILTSIVITYFSGLLIEKIKQSKIDGENQIKRKKAVVTICLLLNLGILFYFKYFDFALNIVAKILSFVHVQITVPQFDIILPVGISFYTFQALSYTIDVYRDDIQAEKKFLNYALFVSFFPQLVAGPIERSKNLLSQLSTVKKFDYDAAREGFLLMLWGFFLKIVVADRIAVFVNTVYGDYINFPGFYLVLATILFAVQIYCDFYGYSTIAIGASQILGIKLMENFSAPYLSTSVKEFWRRWHISLTSWFRDYLYFPLGGSRKGKLHKYINEMIVFLISGLWHGASLSFVIWGGLNGLYQIIGEVLQPMRNKLVASLHLNRNSIGHKMIHVIGTFVLVDFAWIFFRADGLKEAINIICAMVTEKNPWILFDGSLYCCGLDSKNFWLMIICIFILLFADFCKNKGIVVSKVILQQDYWCRWIFIVASICAILTFGIWGPGYQAANFIYFQF